MNSFNPTILRLPTIFTDNPTVASPLTPRASLLPTPQVTPRIITPNGTPLSTPRIPAMPSVSQGITSGSTSLVSQGVIPCSTSSVSSNLMNTISIPTIPIIFNSTQSSPQGSLQGSPQGPLQVPSTPNVNISSLQQPIQYTQLSSITEKVDIVPVIHNFKLPTTLTKLPNVIDVDEANVERKLTSKGYTPLERIFVRTELGPNKVEGRYIKVVNDKGQTALVELDSDGLVPAKPSDLILIESEQASVIPISTKLGTLESCGLDVTGVAFECTNGYCTMVRHPKTLEPKEIVLTTISTIEEQSSPIVPKVAILNGTPIPLPIVKFSEIMANPTSVNKAIDSATRKMRNKVFSTCMEDLVKTHQAVEEFHKVASSYYNQQITVFEKIKEQIRELEKWRNDYIISGLREEKGKISLSKIPANLRVRFEKQMEQMILCGRAASHRQEIERLTNQFKEYLTSINDTIKYLS